MNDLEAIQKKLTELDVKVRHECGQREVFFASNAAQKMRVVPSEPVYRDRLQTTLDCVG